MSNQIKDAFDKASLIKDIDERNSIILNYERSGFLDRDNAIKKIDIKKITLNDQKNYGIKNKR